MNTSTTKPINHWTSEQDARQLEIWSDKHPIICALITIIVAPIYAVIMFFGLLAVICGTVWAAFPHWLRALLTVAVVGGALIFSFYWILYFFLWSCGKLLGA